MATIAIIPARGGSERIPRKNLVPLLGKPLIVHTIECALAAKSVDMVVVSTDDEEIAQVSGDAGAHVVIRPPDISGPMTISEEAVLHILNEVTFWPPLGNDPIIMLQATSPYRLPSDIDGAVELFYSSGADSVFSATPEYFTGRWRMNEDGSAYPVNYDPHNRPRSQDYGVEYLGIGSIYVFRPSLIRETGCRTGGRIVPYIMPKLRSFQVDTWEDLEAIETIMRAAEVAVCGE